MSIATPALQLGQPGRLRWRGDAFDRASEAGVFDGQRVELIEGEVLEMPPMNEPHSDAIQQGNYVLMKAFPPERFTIRGQLPMRLGESRPFPDFVILSGPPAQNRRIPVTAVLIVEVSDTTLEFDRTTKAQLYAKHGIPEYWILNLNSRCLEVRRDPQGVETDIARYGSTTIHQENQSITPLAAPESMVALADLLL